MEKLLSRDQLGEDDQQVGVHRKSVSLRHVISRHVIFVPRRAVSIIETREEVKSCRCADEVMADLLLAGGMGG